MMSSVQDPSSGRNPATSTLAIEGLRTHIALRSGVVRAVDGISLHIAPGETLGLVGESGCGKTITGLSIMNLLPTGGRIVEGSIKLNGQEIVALPDREMRGLRGDVVSVIFQDPMTSLNPTMTVGRQLSKALRMHRDVSRAEAHDRVIEVLSLVGMPQPRERSGNYPHQLSGGLRQRTAIAMALICEPSLVIADEPTTALDVTTQAQILDLLDELRRRLNMAMLLITHDMGIIAGRADRVAVMYAGKLVESATTATLFKQVRHRYTEALIEAIPRVDREVSGELYSIPGMPPNLVSPPAACRFAERCRYDTSICHGEEPPLREHEPLHQYACHHPAVAGVPSSSSEAGTRK